MTKMKALVILPLLLATGLSAEEGPKTRYYGQLEFWSVGGAYDKDKEAFDQMVGFPFNSKSVDIMEGIGLRGGLWRPTSQPGLDWGLSLGYIKGPDGDFTLRGNGNEITQNSKTSFLRLLAELKKDVDLSRACAIRFGAGLGAAQGSIESEFKASGPFFGGNFADSASRTWTGVSWEVSTAFVFKGKSANVQLGLLYGVLPKMSEDDNFYPFEWTPFGVKVGVEF